MAADRTNPVQKTFDDLLAVGHRLSAEARAARPTDQPRGNTARLAGVDWSLDLAGGAVLQNLKTLFTGGYCSACLIPLGERTRWRMKVRYGDSLSRRCDGVLAQLTERPAGPIYRLYTKRFLSLLSPRERRTFGWRAVSVVNPTRTTPELFEVVGSDVHADVVALRGGTPDRFRCQVCGRWDLPAYPLAGSLPDWLNPDGEDIRRDQPTLYLAANSLSEPRPSWYTFGDWHRGVCLAVSQHRWTRSDQRSVNGVRTWPLGLVNRDLVDKSPPRAV